MNEFPLGVVVGGAVPAALRPQFDVIRPDPAIAYGIRFAGNRRVQSLAPITPGPNTANPHFLA